MEKKVSEKIVKSVAGISDLGDSQLIEENLKDWKIEKITLTSKSSEEKLECYWVKENGKWVYKCFKV